ncbi:MAG: endosialidase [Butyrivibrio sp.]|nr:endosialidase [Butyrivibrio sp.]
MSVIDTLIRIEEDGTISFGNYLLDTKTKLDNVEHNGDIYKVKTFNEITKLERNGMFVYESVPGTAVNSFKMQDGEISMLVEGDRDPQITLELEPQKEYRVYVDGIGIGSMTTNISGKLILSLTLGERNSAEVRIVRV